MSTEEVEELEQKQQAEDITPEEQKEIAGYDPTQPIELEDQHLLQGEQETIEEQPVEKKGSVRILVTVGLVATALLTLLGIWFVVKPRTPQTAQTEPEDTEEVFAQETPDTEFKAQTALQSQRLARELNEREQLQPTPTPNNNSSEDEKEPSSKPTPSNPTPARLDNNSPTTRTRTVTREVKVPSDPLPQNDPPPSTSITPRPATPTPLPTDSSSPPPQNDVDPYQRWEQLASLGDLSRFSSETEPTSSTTSLPNTPNASTPRPRTNSIPTVTIGASQANLSAGARGILTRNDTKKQNRGGEIAFGTSTPARVTTPLLWDENNGEQLYNRFAVTLTQDVLSTNESIALPTGTVIVAEATNVGQGNRLVQASGIALIYPDPQGTIQQAALPPETILISGSGGGPLIAQGYFDPGSSIAGQDLLASLLSGIGRVGEVFTEPEQTSTFNNSGLGTSSSSTVINSRNPQIWSAVIDGFFSPLAERLASRSDQQVQELLSRPNVAVVQAGTEVSILFNGFIEVN